MALHPLISQTSMLRLPPCQFQVPFLQLRSFATSSTKKLRAAKVKDAEVVHRNLGAIPHQIRSRQQQQQPELPLKKKESAPAADVDGSGAISPLANIKTRTFKSEDWKEQRSKDSLLSRLRTSDLNVTRRLLSNLMRNHTAIMDGHDYKIVTRARFRLNEWSKALLALESVVSSADFNIQNPDDREFIVSSVKTILLLPLEKRLKYLAEIKMICDAHDNSRWDVATWVEYFELFHKVPKESHKYIRNFTSNTSRAVVDKDNMTSLLLKDFKKMVKTFGPERLKSVTYNKLITVLCSNGWYTTAKSIIQYCTKRHFLPTQELFHTFGEVYIATDDIIELQSLVNDMKVAHYKIPRQFLSYLIEKYATYRPSADAADKFILQLFTAIIEENEFPSLDECQIVCLIYCKEGKWAQLLNVLKDMESWKIDPSASFFAVILENIATARATFKSHRQDFSKFVPGKAAITNSQKEIVGLTREILDLMTKYEFEIAREILNSLIAIYSQTNQVQRVETFVATMTKKGYSLSAINLAHVYAMYVRADELETAMETYKLLEAASPNGFSLRVYEVTIESYLYSKTVVTFVTSILDDIQELYMTGKLKVASATKNPEVQKTTTELFNLIATSSFVLLRHGQYEDVLKLVPFARNMRLKPIPEMHVAHIQASLFLDNFFVCQSYLEQLKEEKLTFSKDLAAVIKSLALQREASLLKTIENNSINLDKALPSKHKPQTTLQEILDIVTRCNDMRILLTFNTRDSPDKTRNVCKDTASLASQAI